MNAKTKGTAASAAKAIGRQLWKRGEKALARRLVDAARLNRDVSTEGSVVKANKLVTAEPDWEYAAKFMAAIGDGSKKAERAILKGDAEQAYRIISAMLGNLGTTLATMTDSTAEPKSVAHLRQARDLLRK
jgi:hypothetical protein